MTVPGAAAVHTFTSVNMVNASHTAAHRMNRPIRGGAASAVLSASIGT
jgi:hypothetical protein